MRQKSDISLIGRPGTLGDLHADFGFKIGNGGAHSARTMMLADLTTLLAISKGATTLLVPVSARKQLNDLPDDMITKVNILYYTDAREALLKAIVE